MPRKWLIIDVGNLCARMFYAYPPMIINDRPTGAIFGFMKMVIDLKEEFSATGLAFCFDKGESLRKKVLPGYHGNRKTTPEDPMKDKKYLDRQLHELRTSILPRIGLKNILAVDGYEADDLVAAVCQHWAVKDGIIVSSDKDLFQCLVANKTRRISQYDLGKKKIVTAESFTIDYGIYPHEWSAVKAIAGCDSDCIPGVEGVGEKTAIKYLCGILPKTSKTYANIKANAQLIERNEMLVCLPYVGLRSQELYEDEDTVESWQSVMGEINALRLVRV